MEWQGLEGQAWKKGPYHGLAAKGTGWVYNMDIWSAHSCCPPLAFHPASWEPSLQALSSQLVESESCTHTGTSEKGASTLAHSVSGVVSRLLLLSKRGFLQKGENTLRKEELARDPRNNKHLSLSPQTHPLTKLFADGL